MESLEKNTIVCSVALAVCALYIQQTGYRPWQSQERVEAQLDSYAASAGPADSFILYAGRTFLAITTVAWAVLIAQSVFHAVRRYRHKPTAVPPLQPLNPAEGGLQSEPAAVGPSQQQQARPSNSQQQKQQNEQSWRRSDRESDLDQRRRRVAEAKQKQLDEAAAAFKEQQQREEARRKELAAQAAAAAAEYKRRQEESQQAARAADAQRWELWEHAVTQHYQRTTDSSGGNGAAAQQQSQPAAPESQAEAADRATAAAIEVEEQRQLRQQQDEEYQASLAADHERQQQKRQQHLLQHLKQLLQHRLSAEPHGVTADEGLTIRVRLPDGTTAVRTFAAEQSMSSVYDWVFSLPAMPCLTPGSWSLATTFPKQSLMPADGVWTQGDCSTDNSQLRQYIQQLEAAVGDSAAGAAAKSVWHVTVRQLSGDELQLQVDDSSTVADVKNKIELITGIPPSAQRLIFSGHILPDNATLQQLGVTAQHTLQLASTTAAQQQQQTAQSTTTDSETKALGSSASKVSESDTAAEERVDKVDSVGSSSSSNSTSGDVLVLSDVQGLRQQVAHSAPQLALYVMTQ